MESTEWYKLSSDEVIKKLESDKKGLTKVEVEKRQRIYKKNIISEEYKIKTLKIFLNQFKSFFIIMFFGAAIISLLFGDMVDFYLIFLFVVIITTIGFFQEYKAEKILKELKKMTVPKTKVLRDGEQIEINSDELVPGDIIILLAGDKVPADCRIIENHQLEVDESLLTGESVPVKKISDIIKDDVEVTERLNMVFSGTTVTHGRCEAVVVETGMKTQIGKIAKIVQQEEEKTPLTEEIEFIGKIATVLIIAACFLILFINVAQGVELKTAFLGVLALTVSAVPESLPIIIAVSLAVGSNNMVKKNALIRKLVAIESLSSIDVICSDKTGTLTKNELTVKEIYTDKHFTVTGSGYTPTGKFLLKDKEIDVQNDERLFTLLKAGVICNDAVLKNRTGTFWVLGSPLEGALLVAAKKAGITDEKVEENVVLEIPFDSERKMMSVVYKDVDTFVYSKGAPEIILEKCNEEFGSKVITERKKKEILRNAENMAKKGLRTLALAYKKVSNKKIKIEDVEKNLVFIGIVGMIDPPREEVKNSVKACKNAGIDIKIVTGDQELTAIYVAKESGLDVKKVINGKDIDAMNKEQLINIVEEVQIFARVTPEHKIRIVEALREKGHRILVTGDGINDAPVLKFSEVGIAMGKGTEVAKEASDIILVDENFTTIVDALEEGRRTYQNIKNSVVYLLATSLAEIMMIVLSLLSNLPFPFIARQILWLNIVTEGIPATGFAFERGEKDLLKRKPHDPKHGFLDYNTMTRMLAQGALLALGTFLLYYVILYYVKMDPIKATTMAFNTLMWFEIFNAVNCRSEKTSNLKMKLSSNKLFFLLLFTSVILQIIIFNNDTFLKILSLERLDLSEWILSLSIASSILILGEIKKNFKRLEWLPL